MLNVRGILKRNTAGLIAIRSDPKATNALVFVHGFRSNSLRTWGLGPDDAFWPFDMGAHLGASVFCYEYLNRSLQGTNVSSLNHKQIAADLLFELNKVNAKRIIFVTHSFGGIVVKQAIHNGMYGEPADRQVVNRIFGFSAIACPNFGHWLARPLLLAQLGGAISSPNTRLLKPNNSELRQLHDNFQQCRSKLKNLDTMTLAEGGRTKLVFRVRPEDAHAIGNLRHDSPKSHTAISEFLTPADQEWKYLLDFAKRRFAAEDHARVRAVPLA